MVIKTRLPILTLALEIEASAPDLEAWLAAESALLELSTLALDADTELCEEAAAAREADREEANDALDADATLVAELRLLTSATLDTLSADETLARLKDAEIREFEATELAELLEATL